MPQHLLFGIAVALAWFALLNLCAAVCFLAGARAARHRALSGASALALRLMPAAISGAGVALLVAPAFTWLEPVRAVGPIERFGAVGGALAVCGGALVLVAAARGLRAGARTRRAMRRLTVGATPAGVVGSGVPLLVTDSPMPVMVLDGIVRPRLYVSRSVRDALTREEFERAVAHELAHLAARDNAKRRLLAFAPDAIGSSPFGRSLVLRWQSEAELAADEAAAGENRAGAVALASALVKVARLHAGRPPLDLERAAFHDGRPIAARVHRLLSEHRSAPAPSRWFAVITVSAAALALAAAITAPSILAAVHQVTEWLVHLP